MSYAEFGQIVTGITGVLLLGLCGYGTANLRFRVPGAPYFVLLTFAAAVWSFGYSFEKAQSVVEGFLLAARIEYLGMAFLPPLWLLVSLSWLEHPLARSRLLRLAALGASLLLVACVWTNDWHHWWYESVVPTGRLGFARYQPGPLYYSMVSLFLTPFLASAVLLWSRRSSTPMFRQKAVIILTANTFPPVFAVAFQLGFRPGGLDPTIFSLIPSFAVMAWGLFRHDFIRIVPIARETVVESLDQAVLVFDPTGRLVDHNRAADQALPLFLDALAKNPAPRGNLTLANPDGARTFRFHRSPIQGPGGQDQGTVTILTDTTEEKRLLDELAHQASHDALTGLANRRNFEDHALGEITRAGRHGGTVALVLFDLDLFKSINDRYGHPAGDRVLKSVAEAVGPRLRPYDLLARIGGEEFAVLMPQTRSAEAREAAERLRAAIEDHVLELTSGPIPVTASFGVATLDDLAVTLPPDPRVKLDALLGLADRGLYRAKAEGRNRVC